MTSQTVSAVNIYRLTLTVDEAFLTDPNTVYPVEIDPELNISDTTHGAGAIEDVGIYEGTPNATANWKYMHVGYYDDTYKVGRILVRLTGLLNDTEYQNMSASQITSATFYMTEATGKAAAEIELYAFKGNSNWTESGATWNNVGADNFGDWIDTVNHGRSVEASYDITDLLKGWKEGESAATAGFILCHSSEDTKTKGFYSSEYSSNTSYRPYIVLTYNEIVPEVYIVTSKDDVDIDAELQLTAVTSPAGNTVTWSTSNNAIASVANGLVSGKKIGTATITATLSNGSSDSKTIYVTIADGVYRIKNKLSGLYLGAEGMGVISGTDAEQQSNISASPDYLAQRWKITHLSSGYYSIRPMHKLNMAMTVTSAIVELSGTSTTDSLSTIPSNYRWKISHTSSGYLFHFAGNTTQSIYPSGLSSSAGADVLSGSYSASSQAFYWSLENVTSQMSNQLIMRDLWTNEYVSTAERYIAPGETLTLSQLGLSVAFVSMNTNTQDIYWTSSNTAVTVTSAGGAVTGVTPGSTATITASITYGEATYTRYYVLHVTAIPVGIYYVRNRETGTYMEIDEASDPYSSGVIMELGGLEKYDSQKWEFSRLDDGAYSIISLESGLALSVQSGYLNVGNTALVQEDYTGADRQKWDITLTSSGSCILRPKSGSSWCMAAASDSTTDGVQVQQKAYVNDTIRIDEWWLVEIGVELEVPLKPQEESQWCWAACAQMFVTTYYTCNYDQKQYVAWGIESTNNEAGTIIDIKEAIDGCTKEYNQTSLGILIYDGEIYSEETLVHIIEEGCPVIVCSYKLSEIIDTDSEDLGHAVIVYGYARLNGEYRFLIRDPWPVNGGKTYMNSYQKMYCGQLSDDDIPYSDSADPFIWHSTVTCDSEYADDTQQHYAGD